MRSSIYLILIFLTAIFSASSAVACIELKLSKTSYLPGETVQLEIDADTTKRIFENDIFFYKDNKKLPTAVFISRITDKKYIAWFNLLSESNQYIIKVRGQCKDGLRVASIPVNVKKPISSIYQEFESRVEDRWLSLSLKEHILASGALSHSKKEQSFSDYLKRSDSCLNSNCTTKNNALTLMAFDDLLLRQKIQDKIEASQNYVNGKGNWNIKIQSDNTQKCNITTTAQITPLVLTSGINIFNLNLNNNSEEKIKILLECEKEHSANIIYSYKDLSKKFEMIKAGYASEIYIDNNGCWGSGLKTECTEESTAYSLLALAITGENIADKKNTKALSWLKKNADTIEEKAIIYYITKSSEDLELILNSQSSSGWWSSFGEYEPDIKTTSIAIFALKNSANKTEDINEAVEKASEWLINNEMNILEQAFALFFALPSSEIEPIISFWPGIVKTESLGIFNIIITNKGASNISLRAELLNITTAIELPVNTVKNVKFQIPLFTTTDGRTIFSDISLDYNSVFSDKIYDNNIPLMIFTTKSSEEHIGKINLSEEEINQSEQEALISKKNELENRTSEISESLLKKFRFIGKKASKSADIKDGPFTLTLRLENQLDKDIKDVSITYTSALIGLIDKIEPNIIEKIEKGRTKTIKIYFTPSISINYEGSILAEAEYDGKEIKTTLPLTINISGFADEKTCLEMGGKVCEKDEECKGNITTASDTFSCCIPADACKKKKETGKIIAMILIFVIVAILIIILFLLKRKPKKEMKAFLEEKAKEYEKQRTKRPSSISRLSREKPKFD